MVIKAKFIAVMIFKRTLCHLSESHWNEKCILSWIGIITLNRSIMFKLIEYFVKCGTMNRNEYCEKASYAVDCGIQHDSSTEWKNIASILEKKSLTTN